MLTLITAQKHADHSLAQIIPWSIFSSSDFFNFQISPDELNRLEGPLQESSAKLKLKERKDCAVLCFLYAHWAESDEVLYDTLKNNMAVNELVLLRAITATNRMGLLQCIIREMPSLIKTCMNSDVRYNLWRIATRYGCLEMLKLFSEFMQPDEIRQTIVSNGFTVYCEGLMNDNQLQMVQFFESFFYEYSSDKLFLAAGFKALKNVLLWGEQSVIDHFLAYPDVFCCIDNNSSKLPQLKVDHFIQKQLEKWRLAEESYQNETPDGCFSLQEIGLAKLFVRRFIRNGSFEAHESLRKILSIQSVAQHMHTEWIPDEADILFKRPNGLLRLALSEKNITMSQCLLTLPAVRQLAKAEQYYQTELAACFDLAAFAHQCDEQQWCGIEDWMNGSNDDCIFRLYQMTKTMVMAEPGYYVCPETASSEFFKNYAVCAVDDEIFHRQLISYLLSSYQGLMKLFVLLNGGLLICYAKHDLQQYINLYRAAGRDFRLGTSDKDEELNFEIFLQHLDFFQNPNNCKNPVDFFHAALIKCFINTYISPYNTESYFMWDKYRQFWYDMLPKGNYLILKYWYVLMRIGGFQIYHDNFRSFTHDRFFQQNDSQAYGECAFILDRYTDKCDDHYIQSTTSKIAAGITKKLVKHDFMFERLDVMGYLYSFRSVYKKSYKGSSQDWDYNKIKALAIAKFIKVAGLVAWRFKKFAFLDVLLQLSKEFGPVYRYYNTPTLNQGLMSIPGISFFNGDQISRVYQHGEFQNTWDDIRSLFRSTENMNEFWLFLDKKIETKIQHVPSVPTDLIKDAIHFFEMSYPGQSTMDWYLSLRPDQVKLNQVLHLTLLELEREHGFNLDRESTGDVVPRFHGFVDSDYANTLLLSRYLFKECSKYLPGILHGENSHRYQWAAICYFIAKGTIRLPEGKNVHDFVTYVIHNRLWTELVDFYGSNFGSPHFVSSWLRNASQFPNLQKAVIIGFCNRINKFMKTLSFEYNILTYERLILMQSCFEQQFSTKLPRIKEDTISYPMKKSNADSNGILFWGVYSKEKKISPKDGAYSKEIQQCGSSSSFPHG
ncbi:hypothetical protein [Legionella worsleiensis]|uniref:Ankyrin repeat protein n=1 Tax=Legionella worsleiensis TaxID=45076 RepID=A0A0W1AJ84_9GAMM|nr:hypothetical protein [Legionella worsleiensis]KTD81366.1 ankyrin repeat protein [Legionella worsleiensis]STY29971.1 ankyrin repeat protein [Legionella worsleiensis]